MNKRRDFRHRPFIANIANAHSASANVIHLHKEIFIRNIRSIHVIRDKNCYEYPLPVSSRMGKTGNEPRMLMKSAAKCLTALLLQYNSRAAGGEVFLKEGRRITCAYGQACANLGFSLREVMPIFLLFRRSILEAIHQTAHLGGSEDPEGRQLFRRTDDFLNALMVTLIGSFHSWEGTKNDAVNPTTQL